VIRVPLRFYVAIAAMLTTLAGAGCLPVPADNGQVLRVADDAEAEVIVAGALHPYALAFAADGRVFYTEKDTGRIRVIFEGTLLTDPFATVPVNYLGARGLLGIALHPDFETNSRVYVYYVRSSTGQRSDDPNAVLDHRVVYFEALGNVARGDEIFVAAFTAGTGADRIGGRIIFAPDGKLLVAVGDLTAPEAAQDSAALTGKILRYNDDGSVPSDNPLPGSPIFARGVREVHGLTIDPVGGIAFGLDRNIVEGEEINRYRPAADYGWPTVAGRAETPGQLEYVAAHPEYADPLYDTRGSFPQLVGGSFNPSTRYGFFRQNDFFFGEALSREVKQMTLNTERTEGATVTTFARQFPAPLTDVAFTPAGTLYVACENAIFRIVPVP